MPSVRVVHTAHLVEDEHRTLRSLLEAAFPGEYTHADWDHTLGGLHVLVEDEGELAAHGAVVQRRLLHRGHALRTGYVESVAVHPDRRGRGLGHDVMAAIEDVIRAGYELGALGASAAGAPLYVARGWQRWQGRIGVLAPDGIRPTPDDEGDIFVLPVTAELELTADLVCDWRDGDVW